MWTRGQAPCPHDEDAGALCHAGGVRLLLGVILAASAPATALAQMPELLTVDAPASCAAGAEAMASAVARLAVTDGFAGRAEVRVVEERAGAFRMQARVVDAQGATIVERALQAPTCVEVLDAA